MILIVGAFVLLAVAVAFAVWRTRGTAQVSRDGIAGRIPPAPWLLVLGALVLVGLSFGFREVPAGFVGVTSQFGRIQPTELPPGLHWVPPIINQVTYVDTRVRAINVEGYTAASREQQDLFMNLTLNYHVDPDRASDILQGLGTDFQARIVMPRFLDIPKSVTDDYGTTQVLNARDEIRSTAEDLLAAELEPYGFVVDGINLENFGYSPEYNDAIEQRQIAEQEVQRQQQILAQQRIQAEQAVVRAEGEASARIEEARGEAEANRLLTESLNPLLLQWQAIQRLQDNINIALVPSDGGLILDVGNLQVATPEPEPTPAP
jgi:regulator of protease activity HflC (stomatin/prohibitin superfamily)